MKLKTELIRKDLKELLDGLIIINLWCVFALTLGAIPTMLIMSSLISRLGPAGLGEHLVVGMVLGSIVNIVSLMLGERYTEE